MCTDKMFHNIHLKCTVCVFCTCQEGVKKCWYRCQASLGSTLFTHYSFLTILQIDLEQKHDNFLNLTEKLCCRVYLFIPWPNQDGPTWCCVGGYLLLDPLYRQLVGFSSATRLSAARTRFLCSLTQRGTACVPTHRRERRCPYQRSNQGSQQCYSQETNKTMKKILFFASGNRTRAAHIPGEYSIVGPEGEKSGKQ